LTTIIYGYIAILFLCIILINISGIISAQFIKQATFANIPVHSEGDELNYYIHKEVNKKDTVLDVTYGPGLLAREFAKVTSQVIGIVWIPAMIE